VFIIQEYSMTDEKEKTEIAKLISKKDLGDGYEVAEYEHTFETGTNEKGALFSCKGITCIEWRWCNMELASWNNRPYVYIYDSIGDSTSVSLVTVLKNRPFPDNYTGDTSIITKTVESLNPDDDVEKEIFRTTLKHGEGVMKVQITHTYPRTKPELLPTSSPLAGLCQDFSELLISEMFSDFTITVGSSVFKVHKNILAARSPVFARMLSTDMVETNTNNIDIDAGKDVMQEMISFMYTGKVTDIENLDVPELLKLAEMYDLRHLKAMCGNVLLEELNFENAGATLMMAVTHRAEDLMGATVKFIEENFRRVLPTEGWKLFSVANLDMSLQITAAAFHKVGTTTRTSRRRKEWE